MHSGTRAMRNATQIHSNICISRHLPAQVPRVTSTSAGLQHIHTGLWPSVSCLREDSYQAFKALSPDIDHMMPSKIIELSQALYLLLKEAQTHDTPNLQPETSRTRFGLTRLDHHAGHASICVYHDGLSEAGDENGQPFWGRSQA